MQYAVATFVDERCAGGREMHVVPCCFLKMIRFAAFQGQISTQVFPALGERSLSIQTGLAFQLLFPGIFPKWPCRRDRRCASTVRKSDETNEIHQRGVTTGSALVGGPAQFTMPLELKERYPFSVDTWTTLSKRKRHHFLTHAHSDHTTGIESLKGRQIFCSETTRRLALRRFPKLQSCRFVILQVGESKFVVDDEEPFTVTAFDANHCPGAVMLLFEGSFGSVLHTGDCRLDDGCLADVVDHCRSSPGLLDCIFLDCTFGKDHQKMPSKKEAFLQVQQCILDHPKAPVVYLACDTLGHEELLCDLVNSFRSKIFVDERSFPDYFADMMIVAPDLVTRDPQSTRFHICEGVPKLHLRAIKAFLQAHKLSQPYPLFIRPSTQWYTCKERDWEGIGYGLIPSAPKRPGNPHQQKSATMDDNGVWHVCYSMHSCRAELEKAMEILLPKDVISTTPNCRANEVTTKLLKRLNLKSSISNPSGKNLTEESRNRAGNKPQAKRVVDANLTLGTNSPVLIRANKKACVGGAISPKRDSVNVVIPIFGRARHMIPPSPPLSFASTDCQSDQDDTFDSQSTAEYIPTCCGKESLNASLEIRSPASDCDFTPTDISEPEQLFVKHSGSGFNNGTDPGSPRNISHTAITEPISLEGEIEFNRTKVIETTTRGCGMENVEPSSMEREIELEMTRVDKTTISGSVWESAAFSSDVDGRQSEGVALLRETTRRWYRYLHASLPLALPSLVDKYNDYF